MGRGVWGGSRDPGSPASSVSGRFAEKLRSMPLTALTVPLFIISLAERCISCMRTHKHITPLHGTHEDAGETSVMRSERHPATCWHFTCSVVV